MHHFLTHLTDHSTGAVATASTSAVATASYLSGSLPLPADTPTINLLLTILGPVLTLIVARVLAAQAAKRRALAALKHKKAEEKKADGDPTNDAEAERLEEESIALQAEADALEALKPRRD